MNITKEPKALTEMARKMMGLWVNPALIIMTMTVVDTDEEVSEVMDYMNTTTDTDDKADEQIVEILRRIMRRKTHKEE